MQVDWKATDEIELQANAMARTHGISDTFKLPGNFMTTGTVEDGIKCFVRKIRINLLSKDGANQ